MDENFVNIGKDDVFFYNNFSDTLSEPDYENFRFKCQRALITYENQLPKVELEKFMKKTFKHGFRVCYIAHENIDVNDLYEHTHVLIEWTKKIDKKSPKFLIYEEQFPEIKKIKTDVEWKCACKFICKEDKEVVLKDEDKFKGVIKPTKTSKPNKKLIEKLLIEKKDLINELIENSYLFEEIIKMYKKKKSEKKDEEIEKEYYDDMSSITEFL